MRTDVPAPPGTNVSFEELFDRARGFFAVLDADGTILRISRSLLDRLEIPDDGNLVGTKVWDAAAAFGIPEEGERLRAILLETEAPRRLEAELGFRTASGEEGWADVTFHFLNGDDGTLSRVLTEAHDVTARKRAREELRRSELELRAVLDNIAAVICVTDTNGRIVRANRSGWQAAGLRSEAEIIGIRPSDVDAVEEGSSRRRLLAMVETALGGRRSSGEVCYRAPDGSIVHVDTSVTPGFDEAGQIFCVVLDARDVTQRVRAAAALKRSESRYRALFEQSRDGIFVSTTGGTVVDGNGALDRILGYERDVSALLGDPLVAGRILSACREGRGVRAIPFTRVEPGGETRELEVTAGPVHAHEADSVLVQGIVRDLTEQRRLERALARAQQHESMGRVAAGVAHEINNPLTWLLARVEEAADALENYGSNRSDAVDAPGLARVLGQAIEGANRIARIVREIRILGRPEEVDAVAIGVEPVLREAVAAAEEEIRGRARVVVGSGAGLRVRIREGQLLQVILNLLVNASRAIEPGNPSRNEIRVTATAANGRVRIEVADTGCGIPPEHLSLLFEPFFSTRTAGEGSGLGLWVCERIVHAAGGRIDVESVPGAGSRFTVTLPEVEASSEVADATGAEPLRAPSAKPVCPSSSATAADARASQRRILVIDDEEELRWLVARTLRREHEVETAGGAAEALSLLDGDEHFDLILSDMMMPEGDGVGFYRELERRRPELAARMTFMTGGACNDRARSFLAERELPFLEKPFRNQTLLAFVRDLLDRFGSAGPAPAT